MDRRVAFSSECDSLNIQEDAMRLVSRVCTFAAALCLSAGFAAAQEANPMYESWAKQKPGTSVTVKTSSEMMGQKTEMETNMKLVEVTPEKAVIEAKTTVDAMGQKMEQPAQKMDIPAKATADQPADPIEAAKKMGAEVKELADETVTVAGKSYTCKVMETKLKQGEMTMNGKSWLCKDMPGMLVKMESTTEGQMAGKTTMEVTDVK
jgi:hypothetical protein